MTIIRSVRTFRLVVSISVLLVMILFIYLTNKSSVLRTANVIDGYKNLKNWDSEKEIYVLNGEWKFYPEVFVGDKDTPDDYVYIDVPNPINISKNQRIKDIHYGTYELILDIGREGQYMLTVPQVQSAYKLYVNGVLQGQAGEISKNASGEKGVYRPDNFFINTTGNIWDIRIEFSNYTRVNSGIINDIYIGTVDNLYRYSTNKLLSDILTVGMLLGLGIYSLLLISRENNGRSGYYFAGFTISSAVISVLINPDAASFFGRDIALEPLFKADITALIILTICIYKFLVSVYPYNKKKDFTKFIIAFDLIYLMLILLFDDKGNIQKFGSSYSAVIVINAIVCFWVIVRSMAKKKLYAIISLTGCFVFMMMGLLEIIATDHRGDFRLYYKNDLYNLGLVFFVLCHTNIFLMEVDRAFDNAALADRMEIAYLHAQIAPHFLFNTLNNLYVLMESDIEKAKDLLMNLSQFLKVKYKFDQKKFDDYRLADEIGFLKSYADIENYRREGKINLEFDFEGERISGMDTWDESLLQGKWYENTKFQPMILQPLVENSIRHGYRSEQLNIVIHVKRVDGYLDFFIEDNGTGMPEMTVKMLNKAMSRGVGIANINYRLSKYCGEKLHFESEQGRGTKIEFRYRMEEAK